MKHLNKNTGLVINTTTTGALDSEILNVINNLRTRCLIHTNRVDHPSGGVDPMVKIITGSSTDENELINMAIAHFPKGVKKILIYDNIKNNVNYHQPPVVPVDFNPAEYMKLNPDIIPGGFNTEALALAHWETYGKKECRLIKSPELPNLKDSLSKYNETPSYINNFDYRSYLSANPDLLIAGISSHKAAYEHWKQHGIKECRPLYPEVICNKKIPIPGSRFNNSIAIILTLYYKDLVYELADYINRLPFPATIYVSAPRDDYIDIFKNILTNQAIVQTPFVSFGMDIGNFITQIKYIKDKNINHDYFLKIHSKRTMQWRRSMLESLLPNSLDDYLFIFKLLG